MVVLAFVIVLYSTAAFMLFQAFSTNIRNNIAIANPLAVKLVDELGSAQVKNDKFCPIDATPTDSQAAGNVDSSAQDATQKKYVIADLQTFAAAIRDMYGAARQMNRLYPFAKQPDPIVPADTGRQWGTPNCSNCLPGYPTWRSPRPKKMLVYQRVRFYAQSTEDNATILTGALSPPAFCRFSTRCLEPVPMYCGAWRVSCDRTHL